jgi:hypothetical protein
MTMTFFSTNYCSAYDHDNPNNSEHPHPCPPPPPPTPLESSFTVFTNDIIEGTILTLKTLESFSNFWYGFIVFPSHPFYFNVQNTAKNGTNLMERRSMGGSVQRPLGSFFQIRPPTEKDSTGPAVPERISHPCHRKYPSQPSVSVGWSIMPEG